MTKKMYFQSGKGGGGRGKGPKRSAPQGCVSGGVGKGSGKKRCSWKSVQLAWVQLVDRSGQQDLTGGEGDVLGRGGDMGG
jgi:hypothetical protein